MTKVYSGTPPPPPREFKNAESYYIWRLYPTRITTRFLCIGLTSNLVYPAGGLLISDWFANSFTMVFMMITARNEVGAR